MGSPAVLDFERLLAPISGDNAAGVNLRLDPTPDSPYQTIKMARTKARTAERKAAEGEGSATADWSPVLDLGPEVIASRAKDLELTAWLIEALVREHGFPGLRDGYRLAKQLVERYWDGLFPLPDEEGVAGRVAALAGLNGLDGNEGTLIGAIHQISLIPDGSGGGPFARWHYRQAADLESLTDPERRQKRIDAGAVSREMIERAEAATAADFCRGLREDIQESVAEFEGLMALLESKCGPDANGQPQAPPSSLIRGALRECLDIVEALDRTKNPDGGAGGEVGANGDSGDSSVRGGGGPSRPGGPIRTREEAFRHLLQVARFFKETEPHSPISYALERAVRWGKMPLPDLLTELIAEDGTRSTVFKLVGIPPPAEPGSS